MALCDQCGHELGIGRFCTNCGHPVGAPTTLATSRATQHHDGRPAYDGSSDAARDGDTRLATPPHTTGTTGTTRPTGPAPDTTARARHVDESRRRGAAAGWVPWVAGLTVMLLLATLGLWLLLGGDREDVRATDPTGTPERTEQPSRDPRTPEGRATLAPLPEVEPADLADSATVRAPRPAPATQDVTGSPVSFVAAHLLDGLPETCWRMPGDGTGETITFGFDAPTEMTEVGLVNGYAKTAGDDSTSYDWYAGNRRTLAVEWAFDDGTRVTQDLRETRDLQTLGLEEPVVTEQVTLRLVEVSPPGTGVASRDYTAISEVRLFGAST